MSSRASVEWRGVGRGVVITAYGGNVVVQLKKVEVKVVKVVIV